MKNLKNYKDHNHRAREKLKNAFKFSNQKSPLLIYNANYWLFGEAEDKISKNYFHEPAVMLEYQLNKITEHYAKYPDDCYIGFLMPWYGTGVLSSSFGVGVNYPEKADPVLDLFIIDEPEKIKDLKPDDFYENPLTAKVLKTIDYFKENSNLPVGVTDCQGPLTTALQIVGYENYIYWMHDYPDLIHLLMEKVTEALIDWVKLQKKHAGQPLDGEAYILGVRIPEGFGGVWISDDDSVIFGSELYREFVVPYNSKVLKAFGGGGIHYCGKATQQIDNYLATEGLTCIHNMMLDDIASALKMKNALAEKNIAYIAGDFSPTEDRFDTYFKDLFSAMDQSGLIVSSYLTTAVGLKKGEYKAVTRDQHKLGEKTRELMIEARDSRI